MPTPKELFVKYVKGDTLIGDLSRTAIMLFGADPDTLTATGEVTASDGCLRISDHVDITHIHDEVWRITSQAVADDHGEPMFLGEEYGGLSIGS